MARIELPFAAQTNSGRTRSAQLERLVNLYPEAIRSTNRDATYMLIGAAGCRPFSSVSDGSDIVEIAHISGKIFAWSRKGLYVIEKGQSRKISGVNNGRSVSYAYGSIKGNGGETRIKMWYTTNGAGYIVDLVDESHKELEDDSFLESSFTVNIDSYAIWSRIGSDEFFWSDIGDFETYNGLSFATAEGNPDIIIGMESFERELWLFGETTTEVWQVTGDSDQPFIRMGNAFLEIGCANGNTVQKLTRDLYWLGNDLRVYKTGAQSYRPEPISLHQGIEHDLYEYGAKDATAYAYTAEGHEFYCLVLPKANRTWVFDEATGVWHERSSGIIPCGNKAYGKHVVNCASTDLGVTIAGGDDGQIYTLDLDFFKEGEREIMREVQMKMPFDQLTHYQKIEVFSQNRANASCEDPLMLYTSRDQGLNWCDQGNASLFDRDPEYRPRFNDLGRAVDFDIKLRTFADAQIVFNKLALTAKALGNG